MSFGERLFDVVKKLLVVTEDVTRLSSEVKELTGKVQEHDVRLAVVENTLALTRKSSPLTLPGN